MSWAEDEGIDTDLPDPEELRQWKEQEWRSGFHKDKDGNKHLLSEMTNEHLKNTIKFFYRCDTSILQNELNKRLTK